MAKKKVVLNKNNKESVSVKKQRLEKRLTEDFTIKELQYSIEFCWGDFMWQQKTKGSAKATIDYYNRFYKKFCSFLNDVLETTAKEQPIATLTKMSEIQLLFVRSMGDVNIQTVNNYLRAYRSFGNFCEKQGYIDGFKCPIKEVEPPIKQVYTDSEIKKLLVKPNIEKYSDYRNYVIINLILSSGARCNTIINIKLNDVDLEERTIVFNTTKAHKTARIPLNTSITRILKEYIHFYGKYSKDGYLFFNEYGEQLTRSGIGTSIKRYNRKRGVEKTSLHLFRHTFAKMWLQDGGDIFTLQKVLTHSELSMVKRYANIYDSDLITAVNEHCALNQIKAVRGQRVTTQRRLSA